MKYGKLKGKMREKGITQSVLANEIGISLQALNAKLNKRQCFTLEEAFSISKILEISKNEFVTFFM